MTLNTNDLEAQGGLPAADPRGQRRPISNGRKREIG
jgi:hypothetical protein